jgi:hypothetical protein
MQIKRRELVTMSRFRVERFKWPSLIWLSKTQKSYCAYGIRFIQMYEYISEDSLNNKKFICKAENVT